MSVAVIEKHPAERLASLGAQRAGGLMTLGDRYSEIRAVALYRAHAASRFVIATLAGVSARPRNNAATHRSLSDSDPR
jgi:hypothetical protein